MSMNDCNNVQDIDPGSLENIEGLDTLHEDDVICAQNRKYNKYSGNVRYKRIIHEFRDAYLKEHQKENKSILARMVIQKITENGGRFVRFAQEDRTWQEIPLDAQQEKVAHALRAINYKKKSVKKDRRHEAYLRVREEERQKKRERKLRAKTPLSLSRAVSTGAMSEAALSWVAKNEIKSGLLYVTHIWPKHYVPYKENEDDDDDDNEDSSQDGVKKNYFNDYNVATTTVILDDEACKGTKNASPIPDEKVAGSIHSPATVAPVSFAHQSLPAPLRNRQAALPSL